MRLESKVALGVQNKLFSIQEIIQKPLNYDRYRDMETELSKEALVEFIKSRSVEYKKALLRDVRYLPKYYSQSLIILFRKMKLRMRKRTSRESSRKSKE
jgi:hypothetical protein